MGTLLDPAGDPLLDPAGDPLTFGAPDLDHVTWVDDFNRPSLGTTGPNGQPYIGAASWDVGTYPGGTVNGLRALSSAPDPYLVHQSFHADATVSQVLLDYLDGPVGLALRWVDHTHYVTCVRYRVVIGGEFMMVVALAVHAGGFDTALGEWTLAGDTTAELTVAMRGADYTVSYDGAVLGTVTDPGGHGLDSGIHGIYVPFPVFSEGHGFYGGTGTSTVTYDDHAPSRAHVRTAPVLRPATPGPLHASVHAGVVAELPVGTAVHAVVHAGTVLPRPARTYALTGAVSGSMAGGPFITRPGEIVPAMRGILFHRPDLVHPVAQLDGALGLTFQSQMKGLGTGTLILGNEDEGLAQIWDAECVVRFEAAGRAKFAAIINEIEHVAIAEGEEHDQVTTITGRDHISVLEEALVYPARGTGVSPVEEHRVFSWPSVDYDDSAWGLANAIVTHAGEPAGPALHDTADGSYWLGKPTDGWPDPNAWWIWAHVANPREWAPGGPCYFRSQFTVPAGTAQLQYYVMFDAVGDLYIDGQLIASGEYGTEPDIDVTEGLIDVTPGTHTVAIVCTNDDDPEGDEIHNPGGIIFTGYPADSNGEITSTAPIVHSDGGWKIVEYPPYPPGMTPGEVIRHVIEEGQARGCFPEIRLAFTDDVDSNGRPWPIVGDIATDVGTNLWTFVGEELAATYVDVWMAPGDFTLYAWALGTRGHLSTVNLRAVTDEQNPYSGNLAGLTHHQVR